AALTGSPPKPLKIASYLGFFFALLSLIGIGFTFYSWIVLNTVHGWASVMTVVLVLGSVQLLVLGVIGEYIVRTFIEAKRRPIFLIDQVLTAGREQELIAVRAANIPTRGRIRVRVNRRATKRLRKMMNTGGV